jgi:hypothetical protein
LANAVLQAKDATIQALQLSNYQLLSEKEKDDNKEDVISGIVSVDKYESSGISVNLAEIFRRLKRKFK